MISPLNRYAFAFFILVSATLVAMSDEKPAAVVASAANDLSELQGEWRLAFKDSLGASVELRLVFPKDEDRVMGLGWKAKDLNHRQENGIILTGENHAFHELEFRLVKTSKGRELRFARGDAKDEHGNLRQPLPYELKDGKLYLSPSAFLPVAIKQQQLSDLNKLWVADSKDQVQWTKVDPPAPMK